MLLRKLFFTKTIVFPKIRYKNVQHFDLELFKFLPLPVPNFFLVPLLSFFSAFQLSLHLHFIFFLAAVKIWVFIKANAWKLDLDQL